MLVIFTYNDRHYVIITNITLYCYSPDCIWVQSVSRQTALWPGHLDEISALWPGHLDEIGVLWPEHLDEIGALWPGHLDEIGAVQSSSLLSCPALTTDHYPLVHFLIHPPPTSHADNSTHMNLARISYLWHDIRDSMIGFGHRVIPRSTRRRV